MQIYYYFYVEMAKMGVINFFLEKRVLFVEYFLYICTNY